MIRLIYALTNVERVSFIMEFQLLIMWLQISEACHILLNTYTIEFLANRIIVYCAFNLQLTNIYLSNTIIVLVSCYVLCSFSAEHYSKTL